VLPWRSQSLPRSWGFSEQATSDWIDLRTFWPRGLATPPRGGRRRVVVIWECATRFNPRPRVRGDVRASTPLPAPGSFNPRPRVRGDAFQQQHLTQASKVCAWIDASNNFDPVCIDLARLLWVRCGAVQEAVKRPARSFVLPDKYLVPRPAKQGLHGGGFGAHPRGEAKGLSGAVSDLLGPQSFAPRCAEAQRRVKEERPNDGVVDKKNERLRFVVVCIW
jgi:hypothetical protein